MDHPRPLVPSPLCFSPPNPPDQRISNNPTTNRPDNCDGSYEQNCDSSREYKNITSILQSQGRDELLSFMDTYWKDLNGDDDDFWAHEWNKHGTCINTIEPSCYSDYTPQEEVGEFFEKVVDLFKGLDTYKVCVLFYFIYADDVED